MVAEMFYEDTFNHLLPEIYGIEKRKQIEYL